MSTESGKIILQMYHNQPPVRPISESGDKDLVWCCEGWNDRASEAAEIAGGEAGIKKAYEQMVLKANPWGELPLPEGPDAGMSVYWLLGSEPKLLSLIDRWAKEIQDEVRNGVGGDDSFYDYFPDYVNGFYQLCSQVTHSRAKIAYNETLDVIQNSESYRDDPETEDLFHGRFFTEAGEVLR